MFNFFRPKSAAASVEPGKAARSLFGVDMFDTGNARLAGEKARATLNDLIELLPKVTATGAAQDDSMGELTLKMAVQPTAMSEMLAAWYASQGFIGHQYCAILAQHWLIDKACSMPGRDAIRNGYDIVSIDGDDLDPQALKLLRRYDRQMRLTWNLEQFIRMGRIFGVRLAFFRVDSTDPDYYEKPFNLDGVTPGSYKGIVQVDPYWCAPQLDGNAAARPDTMHFFEPAYWLINGRRYHRSHLVIYRHKDPPDLLKPKYLYGGIPVPQMVMERVYAAERIANEAPELAMSKRTNVWLTDLSQFTARGDEAIERLNWWVRTRNNYGVKIGDKEGDEFQQFDTTLADLDAVIMNGYQLVAAAANVPATKLLGTTPKGFNATGEYEEANYHEELESIQAHDLMPLIERHHALVMRAWVIPKLGGQATETTVTWRPLDTPTAKELADTNLVKAQTGAALIASGAIASEDERRRIATDPDGGYNELGLMEEPPSGDDEDDDGGGDGNGYDPNNDGDGNSGNAAAGAARDDADFEAKHERAKNGEFGSGGGSGGGGSGGEGEGSEPKRGPFGPILTGYHHDAKGAIKKLTALKDGEAAAALHHPQVGDFALVWGKEGDPEKKYEDGYGLAKIAAKHPEVVDNLQEIISSMKVNKNRSGRNRIRLESADHEASVRLTWNGRDKKWLLTAYKKEEEKQGVADTRTSTTGLDGKDSPFDASSAILARIAEYYNPSLPIVIE
jgi:phage-related protein (TIGR01555 family)